MLAVFAQAVATDPISGGAGWVGAGLLGLLLGWLLMVHLPAKDKILKEFMEAKDAHVKHMGERFESSLKTVAEHCKEELDTIIGIFRSEKRT